MSHFECRFNGLFWRSKKVVQVVKIGEGEVIWTKSKITAVFLGSLPLWNIYIYIFGTTVCTFPTLLLWWWVKTIFGASGFYWCTLEGNFQIKSEGGLFRKDNMNFPDFSSVTEPRCRLTFILLRGGQCINTLLTRCCVLMIYGFYLGYIRSSLPVS